MRSLASSRQIGSSGLQLASLAAVLLAGHTAPPQQLVALISLISALIATTLYARTVVGAEFSNREAALLDPLTGKPLPEHVESLSLAGIRDVVAIDGSPVGHNARSTPATYTGASEPSLRGTNFPACRST